MIDKLDLRIRRRMPFTSEFDRVYSKLRAMDKGPFRAAKYYEYSGDLREYGYNVRLSLYCSMNKVGNHKLELFEVGGMTRTQILEEITQIFDVDDPLSLPVMRVDFAVDVPGVPLEWFHETVRVERKQFRAAVTGERFYSEMGREEFKLSTSESARTSYEYMTSKRSIRNSIERWFESWAKTSSLPRSNQSSGFRIQIRI